MNGSQRMRRWRSHRRPSRAAAVRAAFALAVALGGAGCLDDELDPSDPLSAGGAFVAFERDFQSFRSWTRLQVGDAEVVGGHPAGPRFVYFNRAPSGGAFSVGTIIVKTVETGEPQTWKIHARAKRGGAYNAQGALGWEWFDLRITPSDTVGIIWRGPSPPKNHGYESLPGLGATSSTDGDCNTCHGVARDADFTLATPLRALLTP